LKKISSAKPICSIVSAGCAKYGRREGLYGRELFNEALDELFLNCQKLEIKDVDALYVGQSFETFEHQANTPTGLSNNYGFPNIPSVRIETISSSGGSTLRQGLLGLLSGAFDLVLCGAVEKMTTLETPDVSEVLSMGSDRPFEAWNGCTLPALNALVAREHMRRFGTTEEQLALVAVKNHKNGFENPKAYLRKIVSVKDVLESRKVCTPLKLLDCSPIADGASCVAICKPELARNFTDSPVDIIASAQASDCDVVFRDELAGFKATRIAAKKALEMAGISIFDMDFVEVHDAFTINEIVAYEDLGMCAKGEGGKLIENGETNIDGSIPVNPSGGLKSKGHPIASSGIGQAYEAFNQLGEGAAKIAPSRRVKDAKTAMTHSMGGAGLDVSVHIFRASS
jgi:acetyl-CoA C-acetyltransferase